MIYDNLPNHNLNNTMLYQQRMLTTKIKRKGFKRFITSLEFITSLRHFMMNKLMFTVNKFNITTHSSYYK